MTQCPTHTPPTHSTQAMQSRPTAPTFIPTMQGTKRPFSKLLPTTVQPNKMPYVPRTNKSPFPPRGTGPKTMHTKIANSTHIQYEDDVDYNDIQSLRAYAARTQQYRCTEEDTEADPQLQYENPQDADWNNDINS